MFDAEAYRLIHYVGIFALILGLGLVAGVGASPERKGLRVIGALFHGLGAFVVLVAGVGMLHKLAEGKTPNAEETYQLSQTWVIAKLAIWLALGAMIAAVRRVPGLTIVWLITIVALAGASGWIALEKPF